nr:PREDICTED: tripartite motif-containing protein 34 isoform X1 [Macaca fascicularis]
MNPDHTHPGFSSRLQPGAEISVGLKGSLTRRERTASGVRTRRSQESSAMASKILLNVQEEVTCPICLELLTEPLSLGCGHSLCRACITVSNKEAVTSPGGKSSCPVCGTSYSFENLQTNRHLTNIVERLKEVKLSSDNGKKRDLCDHHGEKLLLFCKEDRKVICWLCERSQEHRGHHTVLTEELFKECQGKLQAVLKRLKKEEQEAEKLEADIREEKTSWKYQVQTERQRIQTEFDQLRSILNSEEQRELQRLEEEEKKRLDKFAEAEDELVQQKQLVRELISDVECRSQWSAMELLQDMSGIMKWSEIWRLKKPKKVSKKLKTVFRAPDLSRMLQMFRELTAVRCYWADVTLNSVNLNLNLVLSEDQRQVISVPIWPFQCYNYGVLGSQYFSSGKHYWEVDVSKKTAWILGVYCRTCSRNIKYVVRRCANHQNVYSKYRPLFGYWVIGLQNKCKYSAFEESLSSDPEVLTLSMAVPPCRVGVFLDYEAGIVSFFNVTSHGSLIYKFSKCCFSQPVYPYFNPWNCPAPMTLCPPSS